MRERIVIATKCGIRKSGEPQPDSPYRYGFFGANTSLRRASNRSAGWACKQSMFTNCIGRIT